MPLAGAGNQFINIQITGWAEFSARANQAGVSFNSTVFDPALNRMNNTLYTKMTDRMHTISTDMLSSTKALKEGELHYSVIVPVGYAQQENTRPGVKMGKRGRGQGTPHKFVEPAIVETISIEVPRLTQDINNFIAKFGAGK
jgi:hypothetical protein